MKFEIFLGATPRPKETAVATRDVANGEAVAVLAQDGRLFVMVGHPDSARTRLEPYFKKGATLAGWAGPSVPGLPKADPLRLVPVKGCA